MNPFYKSIQVRFGTVLAVIFELTSKTNFKPHLKDRLRLNYRYEYRLQIPAVHCNNYYS
jgi:hypothetical protein